MAFCCATCGAEYDASLFQFGVAVRCDCGELIEGQHVEAVAIPGPEEKAYRRLQRGADRIAFLIVATDYPRVDIEIERRNLRGLCQELFPDRMELYEQIYEARFRRLWDQFREE